jgi:hypothetical protein
MQFDLLTPKPALAQAIYPNVRRPTQEGYRVMTRRCSRFSLEDSTELREVHSRLHAKWGSVLDDGQTPCCYALSRDHVLLRAIEKLLELLPPKTRFAGAKPSRSRNRHLTGYRPAPDIPSVQK